MHHNEFACPDMPEIQSASTNSHIRMMTGRQAVATHINLFLICVVLSGTMFQLFGLPYALNAYGLRAAWLLLPIMLLQPLHWGLIHEAIHSHLLLIAAPMNSVRGCYRSRSACPSMLLVSAI